MSGESDRLDRAFAEHYQIVRKLGEGGMASVYLADDLRHGRQVAVKVLREELAAVLGPERFLAEIRTTANLQHPHILPLFDSGQVEGTVYYVMPYVEGESLRDRLERETQLPVEEAVRLAREVAHALDYAHRRGVIHRDIKPDNILLQDGSALVADFGIALAASKTGGARMTETGMSLGTPQYMSPEQAMGERTLDARTDIYALGCVTYEMLLGEPPFTGPTAQAIVAKVMTEKPGGLTARRERIPPHVEAAVLTALEKLPADRFASAGDFAEALGGTRGVPTPRSLPAAVAGARASRAAWLPWAAAAGALALAAWSWLSRPPAPGTTWHYVALGDSARVATPAPGLALAPDGRSLTFRGDGVNGPLWLKRWDRLVPVALPGTERASAAGFSPDGREIAFTADGRLKRMVVDGGAPVILADSTAGPAYNVAWLDDGSIVYLATRLDVLRRVPPTGRGSEVVLDDSTLRGFGFVNLSPLPRGRGVLFTACQTGCITASLRVLDLRTRTQKLLVDEGLAGHYLPGGHLLYLRRDGVVVAAPFDLDRLELTGPGVPVVDSVSTLGTGTLAATREGTLAYLPGAGDASLMEVVRITRQGAVAVVDADWAGPMTALGLSRDGRRLAVSVGVGQAGQNIWVKDLDRGPLTRVSFGALDRRPAWSPDGRMLAFVRDSGSGGDVYGLRLDGSGERLLARIGRPVQEVAWSGNGRWLVLRTDNGVAGAGDLVGVRVDGDTTPVPLIATPTTELHPAVSPDGRWLAYTSNESGAREVYVRPFPETSGGRWQVSVGGGTQPRWSRDGRELYYLTNDLGLMAVPVRGAPGFSSGMAARLFTAVGPLLIDVFHQSYEPTPDGRAFYFLRPRTMGQGRSGTQVVIRERWVELLGKGLHR